MFVWYSIYIYEKHHESIIMCFITSILITPVGYKWTAFARRCEYFICPHYVCVYVLRWPLYTNDSEYGWAQAIYHRSLNWMLEKIVYKKKTVLQQVVYYIYGACKEWDVYVNICFFLSCWLFLCLCGASFMFTVYGMRTTWPIRKWSFK